MWMFIRNHFSSSVHWWKILAKTSGITCLIVIPLLVKNRKCYISACGWLYSLIALTCIDSNISPPIYYLCKYPNCVRHRWVEETTLTYFALHSFNTASYWLSLIPISHLRCNLQSSIADLLWLRWWGLTSLSSVSLDAIGSVVEWSCSLRP